MDALSRDKRYTYEDYVTWPDDKRCELIDGVIYMLAAPSYEHQSISRELTRQLANFLLGKPCQVYPAPVDVRLNAEIDDDTVVQPDLVVICDHTKIVGNVCNGAPDMVIEILSPSTATRDCIEKFQKYLNAGVREYWIVDPSNKVVFVNILDDDKYTTGKYNHPDTISVHVLEGCTINLETVFPE